MPSPVPEGSNISSSFGLNDQQYQIHSAGIGGGTNLTGMAVIATQASMKGEKKTWRPPSNKSARTLCMHRYQKQVGGSLEAFNSYWDALSEVAKAKYKNEVKELIANGVWTNGTMNVIAKFSGLPIY